MSISTVIILFLIILIPTVVLSFFFRKMRSFDELLKTKLKSQNITIVKNEFPGLFKIGPYKKDPIKIEIGKPIINNGASNYKKTYFRKLELKNKNNKKIECWAKIETHWFKDSKVEFRPTIQQIKNVC